MAISQPRRSIGEILTSVPKQALYLILIAVATFPLFFTVNVPNKPVEYSIDFYGQLMSLPNGSRVLIGSDWTNSTRGESMGEFEALLRILMRKEIKFAVYSTGDAQAPQVARNEIAKISKEQAANGYRAYKSFEDYVVLGYFPNSEGTNLSINNDIRKAFAGKTDAPEGSGPKDVLSSPVFEGVKSVADFKMLVLVTASGTNTITLERIKKTPLMFMVTGVMVPENVTYYQSGQLKGLCGGVKGVYDLETMMENGVNQTGNKNTVVSEKYPDGIPGFPGKINKGIGTAYYLTLHFAMGLLILAVIVGNLGMFLSRRRAR